MLHKAVRIASPSTDALLRRCMQTWPLWSARHEQCLFGFHGHAVRLSWTETVMLRDGMVEHQSSAIPSSMPSPACAPHPPTRGLQPCQHMQDWAWLGHLLYEQPHLRLPARVSSSLSSPKGPRLFSLMIQFSGFRVGLMYAGPQRRAAPSAAHHSKELIHGYSANLTSFLYRGL